MSKKPEEFEAITSVAAKLSPKNRAVLRVGAEQLARYDEALRELADSTSITGLTKDKPT